MPSTENAAARSGARTLEPDPSAPIDKAVTIGITGQPVRASVAPSGDVAMHGGAADGFRLNWYLAADDRWHVPHRETTVRQHRVDGTPVVETRVRVPDGDAVQRVWAVADAGGLIVVEVENDSPLPFAVAFSGCELLTERTPAQVPIRGIDLPADSILMPVGHHATVRVAIPAGHPKPSVERLDGLPSALAVVRGWLAVTQRASRLLLPDEGLVEAVTSARCDLLLEGPVEAADDPAGFLLDVAELGRLGDDAEYWMPEIVEPIASIARSTDDETDVALRACAQLAVIAGDRRAAIDIARLLDRRSRKSVTSGATGAPRPGSFAEVRRGDSAGRFTTAIETRLCDRGEILPAGLPRSWLGSSFEVHGIPTGTNSTLSYAVRWHGERPAVLWEQAGDARELSVPSIDREWRSAALTGEALWAAPPIPTRLGVVATADMNPSDTTSFG